MSLLNDAAMIVRQTVGHKLPNVIAYWNIAQFAGSEPPDSYVVFSFETPEYQAGLTGGARRKALVTATIMSIARDADQAAQMDDTITRALIAQNRVVIDHEGKTGADSETAFHVVERTLTINTA